MTDMIDAGLGLDDRMADEGYERGTPTWGIAPSEFVAIDEACARTGTCPTCGATGGEYRPYISAMGSHNYRAFAVCVNGHATEF